MRIVLDTNTLVSGILTPGPPRRLVDAAKAQTFQFCTSETLLAELLDVLSRNKFAARIHKAGLAPQGIVDDLRRIALVVSPLAVPRIVPNDPDDDHVLACAIAAQADIIVSGDKHLLDLKNCAQIPIIKATEALARIQR
jgi:putative PIN family toxin of toxin-antitoxin system